MVAAIITAGVYIIVEVSVSLELMVIGIIVTWTIVPVVQICIGRQRKVARMVLVLLTEWFINLFLCWSYIIKCDSCKFRVCSYLQFDLLRV